MTERRVIRGARLLPMDGRRQLKRSDVLISGGVIAAVGGVASTAGAVVEETNAIVLPGLVNAYIQLDQTLLDRGFVADVDPWRFYGLEIPEWRRKLDDDALDISARAALSRGLFSGTTAFADFGRTLARGSSVGAADEMGARLVALADARGAEPQRAIEQMEAKLGEDSPVTLAVWAGDAERAPVSLLARGAKIAREKNLPFVVRVGLLPGDRSGMRRLERAGALGKNLVIVHGRGDSLRAWIKDLASAGASVIATPSADLMAGAPPTPIAKLILGGVNVGLGTDTGAARSDVNLFRELRLVEGLLRGRVPEPASAALELATRGGARALGLGTGALEVGQRADLIAFDLPLGGEDHESLAHRLIDSGGPEQLRSVWIRGEPVVADGRLREGKAPSDAEEDRVRARQPRLMPPTWADRMVSGVRTAIGLERGWHEGRLPFAKD